MNKGKTGQSPLRLNRQSSESPSPKPSQSRKNLSVSFTKITIEHAEISVNDSRLDYCGTKLAIASSDETVRIFSVDHATGAYSKLADLSGYTSQVFSLAWSHPKFNKGMLASASYDGRVVIWKEADTPVSIPDCSRWTSVFDEKVHSSSVNSVSWCAPKFGAIVAAGSSDGSISVISLTPNGWITLKIERAHVLGCQAVSWSPITKRIASGGNDHTVKVWCCKGDVEAGEEGDWSLESALDGHSDWVFSVEFSPMDEQFVSAGKDGKVLVWKETKKASMPLFNHSAISINQSVNHDATTLLSEPTAWWKMKLLRLYHNDCAFNVSWDPMGFFLCVAMDHDKMDLWKYFCGEWSLVEK